jgi:integrase
MTTPGQLINQIKPGQFLKIAKASVAGSVEARRLTSGAVMFYWRVTHQGKTAREPIGPYDSSAPPKSINPSKNGYSVAAALEKAKALAQMHLENADKGGYAGMKAEKKAAVIAGEANRELLRNCTLAALMDEYADHLKSLGRRSHLEVRSIAKLHIAGAWPKVSTLPANEVTPEQIADMMRKLIESGKGRTANKLRSYIRAAYQTAKSAKTKPSIPLSFKRYAVTQNPAADTEPDESQNRPDKNPLSRTDLQKYWRAVRSIDGFKGAVLRLHLLTGGQRIEQLVNLRTNEIRPDGITIYDGKGRPGRPPRAHHLPLLPEAKAAMKVLNPEGEFAISTESGETHLAATTLSRWACEAAESAHIEGFNAKRVRSGIETLLASVGISQEVRGRLQSHGIGGVQARHYDGHDYSTEKLMALKSLFNVLDTPRAAKRGL